MPESLADVPGLCGKTCDVWFYICTEPHGMPMITVASTLNTKRQSIRLACVWHRLLRLN